MVATLLTLFVCTVAAVRGGFAVAVVLADVWSMLCGGFVLVAMRWIGSRRCLGCVRPLLCSGRTAVVVWWIRGCYSTAAVVVRWCGSCCCVASVRSPDATD